MWTPRLNFSFSYMLRPAWSNVRLVHTRLFAKRLLLAFFTLSLIHAIVLVTLRVSAMSHNVAASHFLRHVVFQANLSQRVFLGDNPHWETAPAVVQRRSAEKSKSDGIICDDSGRSCWEVDKDNRARRLEPFLPVPTRASGSALANVTSAARVTTRLTSTNLQLLASSTAASTSTASSASITARPSQTEAQEDETSEDEASDYSSNDGASSESSDDGTTDSDSDGDGEASTTQSRPQLATMMGLPSEISQTAPSTTSTPTQDFRSVPSQIIAERDIMLAEVVKNGETVGVRITREGSEGNMVPAACAERLGWPINRFGIAQVFDNTVREDIAQACFFIWVLGMSIAALLTESIPHLIAALTSQVLSVAWSGYTLAATSSFNTHFHEKIIFGPCEGISLIPGYWKRRGDIEIALLVINAVSLIAQSILTWKLAKDFGWQTFKRVGASITINRIYKVVLSLSTILQLDAFFLLTLFGLWLDQMTKGVPAYWMLHKRSYTILYAFMIAAVIPWIALGWVASRRENRLQMDVFLAISLFFIVGWAVSFECKLFLLTFKSWRFFAVNAVIAATLTVATVILAVTSRLQFGKGLLRYLEAYEGQGSDPDGDFTIVPEERNTSDREKCPTLGTAVLPTFSSAFPSGNAPPPSIMFPPALPTARPARAAQPSMYSEASWAAGDDTGRNALGRGLASRLPSKSLLGSSYGSTMSLPRT